jgi:hypothetical protein
MCDTGERGVQSDHAKQKAQELDPRATALHLCDRHLYPVRRENVDGNVRLSPLTCILYVWAMRATAVYVAHPLRREREREWAWWAHTGGGNALAFKPPPMTR